ncbi:Pyrophosphate--fructose 6-phosphate 1-phosphotransferase [Limihaloglobus sulfuriphilus]|uniref:Pyrophosphate--fructose 6-phosphate 1-phosphotransferase n=1 Tax=Limihaloglobus sulfuriphilus TaxID=1851148 RepID=A0A1Q2MBG4_9BACT|nr:diphosphate--fructose-6-phosphate 1-phosphotransferase [Limihaloglobus sulfuriphilus]AQQ70000.1 Pyrophosphate--fructose 6-phosphate 1-phosphotransferase [Limihaloglobus sulfuriphilus]
MLKGNAIIGQSGGPTSVINSSLAGVIDAAIECPNIDKVLGMRYGIEGFMQENIVDLAAQDRKIIDGLRSTPSSALGSCRHKLQEEDLPVIIELLKKYNIRYVFLIGGNDTMDTIHRLEEYSRKQNYELCGIGIPKTVDNDLFGTDHTPGFPSAARYMTLSVQQAGVLARDMKRVDQFVVFQCIGREAGWLPAATALAKKSEEDAPHILCLPERPFIREKFFADVEAAYKKYGFVSIVCGEGIMTPEGRPVSASETRDKFSNVEFGAMGGASAAIGIHSMISSEFGFRGEFQITESLPMCGADRGVQLDFDEAYLCGRTAVKYAEDGKTGVMVTLERGAGQGYSCVTGEASLSDVAVRAKPMPDNFISEDGNFVTDEFIDYVKPLVGELPDYVKLSDISYK